MNMPNSSESRLDLFGGSVPWSAEVWTDSDDRVRGGKSQSYLECPSDSEAVFRGCLDISALGVAGFASQRTVDPRTWDLSGYDGLRIRVGAGDGKKYTLILKDETPERRADGREQSTVSWEYNFTYKEPAELFAVWADFEPTYRGKPKSDAKPLDLKNIRRISFMMRSFFTAQEGPFRLEIKSLAATTGHSQMGQPQPRASLESGTTSCTKNPPGMSTEDPRESSWLGWACGLFRRQKL